MVDREDKPELIAVIIARLQDALPSASSTSPRSDVLALLTTLKLAGRDATGCDALYSEEALKMLQQYAGLGQGYSRASLENDAIPAEALKVIANALYLQDDMMPIFDRIGGLTAATQRIHPAKSSRTEQFLLGRILFLMTADPAHVSTAYNNGQTLNTFEELFTSLDLEAANVPEQSVTIVCEVLKVIFNFMTHMRSLESKETKPFHRFIPVCLRVLRLPLLPSIHPMAQPHSHAIHCLINFPANYDILFSSGETAFDQTMSSLGHILEIELKKLPLQSTVDDVGASTSSLARSSTDLRASPDDYLAPLFALLIHFAADNQKAKERMQKLITPEDLDRSVSPEQGKSITHRLMLLMTNVEFPTIKSYAEELLFILCDRDASKLVAYLGFGNAAGFLVNRGMLNASSLSRPPVNPNINPITGQLERPELDELMQMTDEEKEAEAERLFVLFDKLNQNGIIKAIDPTTGLPFQRPSPAPQSE
ncbi:hypothetical protein RI367_003169 [Sorochytrium milnesiophthora]